MKIKSIILGLSFFTLSVMGSDCDDLNNFLIGEGYKKVECCGNSHYILCDEKNNIKSINFDPSIMSNYIKPFSLDKFPMLPNLEHLILSNIEDSVENPLNGQFPLHLLDLPSLQTLEITRLNINTIGDTINENSSIETIKLSSNKLTTFPYQFKSLPNLTNLDVSSNLISGRLVEDQIKEFKTLKYLNLDHNKLEGELFLPDSIEHIKVINNQFNRISKNGSIANLQYVEAINNIFDDNILNTLIDASKLKTLTLGGNIGIKSIPDKIYLLNSLENLDLSSTSISVLPNNFFALSNLHYLNIANNTHLNPYIVNFGNTINVCDFTNTKISCYQPNTCALTFGSVDYRDCNDYEIKKVHEVDAEVTDFVKKEPENPLLKYLILVGIACAILIIIGCVYFIYKRRSNKRNQKSKFKKPSDDDNSSDASDTLSHSNNKVSFSSVSLTVNENDPSSNHLIRNSHSNKISNNSQSNRFSTNSNSRNSNNRLNNSNSYSNSHIPSNVYTARSPVYNSNNRAVTYANPYNVAHGPIAYSVAPTVFSNLGTNVATVQSIVPESEIPESVVPESNILGSNILGSNILESNIPESTILPDNYGKNISVNTPLPTYHPQRDPKDSSFAIVTNQNTLSIVSGSRNSGVIPLMSNNSAFFAPSEFTKASIDEKEINPTEINK